MSADMLNDVGIDYTEDICTALTVHAPASSREPHLCGMQVQK